MRAVNKNVPYHHENHLYSLRHSRFNPPQPISCDRYHTSRNIFKILIISLLPHNPGTTNLLNTEFFICSPAYNKLSAKSFSNDNCLRFQGCYPHRPLTLRRSAYWKAFSPSLDCEKKLCQKNFFPWRYRYYLSMEWTLRAWLNFLDKISLLLIIFVTKDIFRPYSLPIYMQKIFNI